MIVCRDASELVTDYMEQSLAPRTWMELRWHLFRCEMCRNYYAQMRATVALLASGPPTPPPPGMEEQVLNMRGQAPDEAG